MMKQLEKTLMKFLKKGENIKIVTKVILSIFYISILSKAAITSSDFAANFMTTLMQNYMYKSKIEKQTCLLYDENLCKMLSKSKDFSIIIDKQ